MWNSGLSTHRGADRLEAPVASCPVASLPHGILYVTIEPALRLEFMVVGPVSDSFAG